MDLERIKKSNLVDEVYRQLVEMLASGDYPEGSRLPSEAQLCETLGVSRNTVRTAISKLIALGVLENQQGYGNCVRNMNIGLYANTILPCMLSHAKDLISATEFRIGVESMAAALAAERAEPEDIDRLYEACEKAANAINDTEEFAQYDMEFHRAVAAASKNPLFIRTSEMIEAMYTTWLIGFQRSHGKEKSHVFHSRICEAIAEHNPVEAERWMKLHLEDVLSKIMKDLDKDQAK